MAAVNPLNLRHCLHVAALGVCVAPRVAADPAVASGERSRVAYAAPASCPNVSVAQELLGDGFVVQSGPAEACLSCTRSIAIEERPGDSARFHVVVSAADDHREELARPVCSDVLAFAAHVVLATHVEDERAPRSNPSRADDTKSQGSPQLAAFPRRDVSTERPFRVGVFGSGLLAPASGETFVLLGGGAGIVHGPWRVAPHLAWIAPRDVESPLPGAVPMKQEGYAAGIDLCRRAYANLQACGLGSVRWMTVDPGPNWSKRAGSEVLFGAAVSWLQALPVRLELELQLGALIAPVPMPFQGDQRQQIYTNPAFEVQLRVGLAWSFGAPWDTPSGQFEPVSRAAHP